MKSTIRRCYNAASHGIEQVLIQLKRVTGTMRWPVFDAMRADNIGVHVHYIPVYWHPYYQQLGYKKGLCPVAEAWYEKALTLPIHTHLNEINNILNFTGI